jgi:hypothetical protein
MRFIVKLEGAHSIVQNYLGKKEEKKKNQQDKRKLMLQGRDKAKEKQC